MPQFYGYGYETDLPQEDFQIAKAIPEFNEDAFGEYIGLYYNIGFFPALLFVAPIVDNFNRKCIIGFCAIIYGFAQAS